MKIKRSQAKRLCVALFFLYLVCTLLLWTCNEKCFFFVVGSDGRQRRCMSYILHYYPLTLAAVFFCQAKPQRRDGNQQNNVLFPILNREIFKRVWFDSGCDQKLHILD